MKQTCMAALFTLSLATGLVAAEPKELAAAKKEFAQNAHPDEAARAHYVQTLAGLRDKLAKSNGDWQAVDEELRKHPAPGASAYTALRVGEWTSPRHGYVYRKNGTWSMTPVEADATHGTWKIEGNQYFSGTSAADTTKYTIIWLTAKDFIFTDGKVVFFEKKGK